MKKSMKLVVLLSALLVAIGAFAGDKYLTFSSTTSVNGTQLKAGEYKVSYKVNGSTADVQIKKDGEVVATASGQLVEKEQANSRNSIVVTRNGDGTSKLVEIQIGGQKSVIRLNDEGGSSSGGSQ